METIRDGQGNGHLAGVTSENMLKTRALMIQHEFHHASHHANGYVATTEHTQVAGGAKEIVATLEYHGQHQLVLSRVAFNSDSAGSAHFYIYGGAVVTSVGTTLYNANTNSGSRNTIDADVVGTADGTTPITYSSLGVKMWEIFMGYHTTTHHDLNTHDAFIIKPGSTITFAVKSATTGDGSGINLFFYEEGDI